MTRLLVSVRNVDEARAALRGGAQVIDVKEPSRGALGAADPKVWRDVVAAVAGQAPVSVALGELCALSDGRLSAEAIASLIGVRFAKLGLAGCVSLPNWQRRWRDAIGDLPDGTSPVAVAYADAQYCEAPPVDGVLEAAIDAGVSLLLVDTYDKSAGGLLEHLSIARLAELASRARATDVKIALAGSLTLEVFEALAPVAADYIAVRGAACSADRQSAIDEQRVRRLSIAVQNLRRDQSLAATTNA